MRSNPLVSIVTPTLDAIGFLDEYADSVLSQSYKKVELIFVDGGSTDGTLARLHDYQHRHPDRVRVVLANRSGVGTAWNLGLKTARGEIFGCLGADDICEPGAIGTVVDYFERHPEAQFLHGACELIDEAGTIVSHHRPHDVFDYDDFVNTAREIATPSAYCRREVMERIGWLDSSGDDFDVMLRVAKLFRVHSTSDVLSRLRIRRGSAFNRSDLRERLPQARETFLISRRHGGGPLSRIAVRYYVYRILAGLRLAPLYNVLKEYSRDWRRRLATRT